MCRPCLETVLPSLTLPQTKILYFKIEALPPTGSDAVVDGCAVSGRGPRPRGPADGAQAEGVQSSGEHPFQDAAAGSAALVRVDDGQAVSRSPLQVKVVVVGVDWAAPGDLQRGVGDSPEQEGGGRSGN